MKRQKDSAQIETGNECFAYHEHRSFYFVSCRSTSAKSDVVARERSPRRHLRNYRNEEGTECAAIGKVGPRASEHGFNLSSFE